MRKRPQVKTKMLYVSNPKYIGNDRFKMKNQKLKRKRTTKKRIN